MRDNKRGTIEDRGMDYLIPPSAREECEAILAASEYDIEALNHYQELAAETVIYPRVYTEAQVREIAFDVIQPWVEDKATAELIGTRIDTALDERETPFNRLVYPILGLVGEAGEIANKAKKIARDDGGQMDTQAVEDIGKELGDVGWYWAAMATELGTTLRSVASKNIAKLYSRKERGVLGGSGDNR